jgi:hypothetical protein
VTSLALDRLRREGEQLMEELSREHYETHAGLKPTADLQPIYARHADILSEDALLLVREMFLGAAPGSENQRTARLLLEWQVESQVSHKLAPLDEREIAWESSAVATA